MIFQRERLTTSNMEKSSEEFPQNTNDKVAAGNIQKLDLPHDGCMPLCTYRIAGLHLRQSKLAYRHAVNAVMMKPAFFRDGGKFWESYNLILVS